MQALRKLVAAVWGQAVAALVMLLSLRLYSSLLEPEAFGLALLATTALALIDGVCSMAFAQTLAQMLKDEDTRVARIGLALGLGRWFAVWQGILYGIAVLLVWASFGPEVALWVLPIVALYCLFEIPRAAGMTLSMLERRFGLMSTWNALDAVSVVIMSLIFLKVTGNHPVALVLGALAGRALTSAMLIRAALGPLRDWSINRAAARLALPKATAFGWSIALMAPLGWLGAFADRYIVGATVGMVEAGVLAALAGAVMRPYGVLSAGIGNIFRPDLLDQAAGRAPRHSRPLARWLGCAIGIGLAGIAGFWLLGDLLADFLIAFATPGLDRGDLMTLLAASQMMVLMSHAFDNRLLAIGRSRSLLATQVVTLAGGLPLVALGASLGGATGAAAGRLGAEALRMAGSAILAWRARRVEPVLHKGPR